MARIVCVHGIGAQFSGEEQLRQRWVPALLDGVRRADRGRRIVADDVAIAFYGDIFRRAGRSLGHGANDAAEAIVDELEEAILLAWWESAATKDTAVVPPNARSLARSPRPVTVALRALSSSRFFAGVAIRAMVADLRQVRRYLTDSVVRSMVQERVAALIGADTRIVVGHSLGSVVAYEALAANPSWQVRALVTLGSPLGTRNLVFDRLQPAPSDGRGRWPGGVLDWTNIADDRDVVALVPDLRPQFGDRVRCVVVHNGSHAHDAAPYLSAVETGQGILRGFDL